MKHHDPPSKKLVARFFKTEAGNEPVRDLLKEMGRPTKTIIGEDIAFAETDWRVDKPYVDKLRSGRGEFEKTVYEVRHTVEGKEYRTLFFVYENLMVLVHLFQKTSQKTPKHELDLAWKRMKQFIRETKRQGARK